MLTQIDPKDIAEFRRIQHKLDTIRGAGVTNTKDSITIVSPRVPPPAPPPRVNIGAFLVTVSTDGGADGTATTANSYTYTVIGAESGDTLKKNSTGDDATVITPLMRRPKGKTTAGVIGMAQYFSDGTLQLIWVDEIPTKGGC